MAIQTKQILMTVAVALMGSQSFAGGTVGSANESDSLVESVQYMYNKSWDINNTPITSTQDIELKKMKTFKHSTSPTAVSDLKVDWGSPIASPGSPIALGESPIASTGDPTAGRQAQFEKVLLPPGPYGRNPRCKLGIIKLPTTPAKDETLTLGSGSQLQLSKVDVAPAGNGQNRSYVGTYDVLRNKEKKAELTLTCDLSDEAAVTKGEIQTAFSKLGFTGTVQLGLKDPPKAASKETSSSQKAAGAR